MTIPETIELILSREPDIVAAEDCYDMIRSLDRQEAIGHTKRLLPVTARLIQSAKSSDYLKAVELRKDLLLYIAPDDFDSYLQILEFEREADKRFYLPRRKTLKLIVDEMQKIADDELDLLCISLPPGSGKSTLNIFFLTWIMGKYPDQPNLASAHSDKLTRSYYDGVISILTDPDYLWSDVFPGVRIAATNAKDESIDLNKNKRFKTLTCRSIGGSLTGATRCERVLVADDLVSGIEEALSKQRMDSLWEAYTNDLKTRKKENCKEIHIATRWSVHDCIGRLERQYADDPKAKFISIPALNENEESNFDYSGGVGFSTKYFIDMKESLDDVSWRCLFQQEPIEREGLLYHEDDLRRYYDLPDGEPDEIISVVDTKDKGTDYCVLLVAYNFSGNYYIDDCICDNGLPEIVDARLVEILSRHKVQRCRFESNSAGGRIAEKVQEKLKEKGCRISIETKFTTANKETKIIMHSAWVKEKCLFKSGYPKSGDYARMINFLCAWTMTGKNKKDDVPDTVAMLSDFVQSMVKPVASIFRRTF